MIEERITYRAVCDNCGLDAGTFDARKFPGPQHVTIQLLDRHGWTAFDGIHHCYRCPPICASCGSTHDDGDCTPRMGDAAYVSREPTVIAQGEVPGGQG